ncbi:MAG: hypothetical protein IH628_17055, partial [Proteobacteria bacterium]|nr:hypothetical protein [Pseudomonadota bacterium]
FYPAHRLLVPEKIDNTLRKPCYSAAQGELMELEDLTREILEERCAYTQP